MTPTDPRVDPPEQPKTVKDQAAVPVWAVELTQAMKSGIAEVRADVALVSNDLGLLKTRVSIMEGLRTEDDMRASKYSGGIKNLSKSDEGQNMQIASLAVKVDALGATLADQSDFMGMGKKGMEWLRSKEARADIVRFVTLIGVGYAALKTAGIIK